jgi:hypothetical protein
MATRFGEDGFSTFMPFVNCQSGVNNAGICRLRLFLLRTILGVSGLKKAQIVRLGCSFGLEEPSGADPGKGLFICGSIGLEVFIPDCDQLIQRGYRPSLSSIPPFHHCIF